MRTKRLTVTMFIVVAISMLLVGCGSDDTTDAGDKPDGTDELGPDEPG